MSKSNKFNEIFREPELRTELSIEEIVKRQIERTNIAASYGPRVFAINVGILKSHLPTQKRMEVEMKASKYNKPIQFYKYKYDGRTPLGTPEHPIMGSPKLVEKVEVDYDKLYELVLDAFEELDISWKVEREITQFRKL